MDEPLSNLDAKLHVAMRSELIQLHKRLKTTFIHMLPTRSSGSDEHG